MNDGSELPIAVLPKPGYINFPTLSLIHGICKRSEKQPDLPATPLSMFPAGRRFSRDFLQRHWQRHLLGGRHELQESSSHHCLRLHARSKRSWPRPPWDFISFLMSVTKIQRFLLKERFQTAWLFSGPYRSPEILKAKKKATTMLLRRSWFCTALSFPLGTQGSVRVTFEQGRQSLRSTMS